MGWGSLAGCSLPKSGLHGAVVAPMLSPLWTVATSLPCDLFCRLLIVLTLGTLATALARDKGDLAIPLDERSAGVEPG
jgi:hypothetical protein